MTKYKISLDREGCIGCGVCASIAPDFFEMDTDGKTTLKGAKKDVLELDDYNGILDAAEACPVNVIHVFDVKANKKLK